jgi:hypothetical protein
MYGMVGQNHEPITEEANKNHRVDSEKVRIGDEAAVGTIRNND